MCAWEAAAGSVGTAAVARTRKSLIRIITKGENIRKHESRILIAK